MYYRIALNNVKNSYKNYTIYFFTLVFAVCIFYSFNSIGDQGVMANVSSSQANYAELMEQMIEIVSIFVSVILAELIVYATNFLINRRKKEFGIYMTLGMKRRKMVSILFVETLIIGAVSLVVGLLLGIVLSQGLSILVSKLFVFDMTDYKFIFSKTALVKTLFYFALMYLLSLVFNMYKISKYKLINLLYGNKKSEKVKVKNIYVSIVLFAFAIGCLATAYSLVEKTNLDFQDIRFTISIVLGVIGTAAFFYSLSSVVLYVTQRNKKIYLKGLNIFSIRQIASKFNTNFMSMTTICLMLFVTIGILSSGLGLKKTMENSLDNKTPFDASFSVYRKDLNNKITIKEILEDYGYEIGTNENYITDYLYLINVKFEKDITEYIDGALNVMMPTVNLDEVETISISDLNEIRKMSGKDEIKLNDDEVIVMANTDILKDSIKKYLNENDYIEVNGKRYKLQKDIYEESIKTEGYGDIPFGLIVSDDVVEGVLPEAEIVNINYKDSNDTTNIEKLSEIVDDTSNPIGEDREYYIYDETRQGVYEKSRGLTAIILFLSLYLGVIFLLASVAVLALQQLSHCNDSIERYESLKKIGVSERMINKSIFIQVFIFFMMPLSLAIVHSIVGIDVVSKYIEYFGNFNIVNTALVTALLMLIVYGGYFYATYRGYKNVVSESLH